MKRKKESRNKLGYLWNPRYKLDFSSFWWSKNNIAMMAASVGILGFVGYSLAKKFKKPIPTPPETGFVDTSFEDDETLEDIEIRHLCSTSYKRIPIKGEHKLWNIMTNDNIPPAYNGDPKSLHDRVIRNIRRVTIYGKKPSKTYVLGMKGSIALINTHAIKEGGNEVRLYHGYGVHTDVGDTGYVTTILQDKDICHLGNDLSLINLQGGRFKNIISHISASGPPTSAKEACFVGTMVVATVKTEGIILDTKPDQTELSVAIEYYCPDHVPGMCGLPLIMRYASGSAIAGIHAGGLGNSGFATPLYQDIIRTGCEKMLKQSFLTPVCSESMYLPLLVSDPLPKSLVRYEYLGKMKYHGRLPGAVLVNKKSNLTPTPFSSGIYPIIKKHFEMERETVYGPPLMKPAIIQREYISPYNVAIRGMASKDTHLDHSVLKKCIVIYTTRIVKMLKQKDTPVVRPLTLLCAINGALEDPFIRRIDASKSGGFGYPGYKSGFLPILSFDNNVLIRGVTDKLKNDIKETIHSYERNESPMPIFTAQLKDEPRSLEKIKNGKTRLFYMSPLQNLIVSRMFLAPFYSLMVENNDVFCCAVGINMHSSGGEFFTKLHEFSPYICEGDYKNYDLNVPFEIKWGAATIVSKCVSLLGYNDHACTVVENLTTDMLFPNIEILKDLFTVPGLQPSGKYATAEDNSLVGVLLLLYCWYTQPETKNSDFFEYVKVATFGDDVLWSVKEEFSGVFNILTYTNFCKVHYNMIFTSPSKGNNSEACVTVDTCSFLKRTRQWNETQGKYVAGLSLDSIIRSMEWFIPSIKVPMIEQIHGSVSAALWEIALFCNRDRFESVRNDLLEMIFSRYAEMGELEYPTYDKVWNTINSK